MLRVGASSISLLTNMLRVGASSVSLLTNMLRAGARVVSVPDGSGGASTVFQTAG